jgi:hypothetical protein
MIARIQGPMLDTLIAPAQRPECRLPVMNHQPLPAWRAPGTRTRSGKLLHSPPTMCMCPAQSLASRVEIETKEES